MTTTDPFTEAARAEAGRRYAPEARLPVMKPSDRMDDLPRRCAIDGFTTAAEWARAHLAAQEPTDAEVLAALNAQGVVVYPKMRPAPSLDYWGDKPAEAMRAALSAARAGRAALAEGGEVK